jgi:putative transposase
VSRPPQRGARGYEGGKKVKGRTRPLVVDSQGSVLGVWVSPADVSDAQGARAVLERVLPKYPSVQRVIADGAYDKEGLLAWLLGEFYVALDCVGRVGGIGFVVLLVSRADFCVVVGVSSFGSL